MSGNDGQWPPPSHAGQVWTDYGFMSEERYRELEPFLDDPDKLREMAGPPPEPLDRYKSDVKIELYRIKVRDEAKQLYAQMMVEAQEDGTPYLITGTELLAQPVPEWWIEDLMPPVGKGHIYGPSYVGKSLLAIDLCLSVANGLPTWQGWRVNRPGRAVYVAMEGGFGLQRRIQAWLTAHPGLQADHALFAVEKPLDLANRASVDRLMRVAWQMGGAQLVVVDTQGLATPGADENSSTAMNQVLANCGALSKALGCFVLLVHHTGWDESRERGSSAQRGGMDLRLAIGQGQITVEKVKDGEEGTVHYFDLQKAGRSVYARAVDRAEVMSRMAGQNLKLEQAIIEHVRANPGCTKNAVCGAVGGDRNKVSDVITLMIENPGNPLVNAGTEARWKLDLA